MLASRKYEWVIEEEIQTAPSSKPAPQHRAALRAKCLLMAVMIAIAAMFITVRSEAIIRAGYDLVQLKAQAAKMEKENEALKLEIARLKSPQRIQHIATNQLGMVVPQNVYCAADIADNDNVQASAAKDDNGFFAKLSGLVKSGKLEANRGH